VISHAQLTVDEHPEVRHRRLELHACRQQRWLGDSQLVQLLSCPEPNQLHLVGVHLEPVAAHPGIHLLNTRHKLLHSRHGKWSRGADVQLCVISVRVASKSGARNDVEQYCHIQQEQQQPQQNGSRQTAGVCHLLGTAAQE